MPTKNQTKSGDNEKGENLPLSPVDIPDGPTEGKIEEPVPAKASVSHETFKTPMIGEMVLFNHKTIHQVGGPTNYLSVPMVVTFVHMNGTTVDGIFFNTQNSTGQVGAAAVYGVNHGQGEACWRKM